MRIALVHPHLNGISGVELHHAGLCRFLVERGNDVHVYGDPSTSDLSLAPGVTFHAVRAPVLRQSRLGTAWYVWKFAREASRLLEIDRARYDVVHARGECLVAPDIYHVTGIQLGERRRAVAGRGVDERAGSAERRMLFTRWHGRSLLCWRASSAAFSEDPRVRAVHAEGVFVRDDLVSHYGIDPASIEVIPPPVDTSRFVPTEDRGALRKRLGCPTMTY